MWTRNHASRDAGDAEAHADLTVTVPAGKSLSLHPGVGRVDVPAQGHRSADSEMSGRIGDGQGRVVLDSGSGSIRIVRR